MDNTSSSSNRENIEERLRISEDQLRGIFDNAVDGIITINHKGKIRRVNPAVCQMFGYEAKDLVGAEVTMLMPGPIAEQHQSFIQRYFDTGEARVVGKLTEVMGQRANGSQFPVELTVSEVHLREGRLFTGVLRDISSRKNIEQSLKDNEERLRRILESAVDSILAINAAGIILNANRAAEQLFGYTQEELVGNNINMLMPEPYHSEHDGYIRNYLTTGEAKIIGIGREVVGKRKNGSTFPMELAVSQAQTAEGMVFTGIVRDVSERKDLIAHLEHARDEALNASKLKSEFLANMSHEIRTPMNAIIGLSGLLRETNLSNEQRRLSDIISNSAESLLVIINDILDFSKMAAGKLELELAPFSLADLLHEVADMIESRSLSEDVKMQVVCDERLPESLVGDAGRLRQILVNLVGNAAKFTSRGQITVSAECLDPGNENCQVKVCIRDTGLGIAEDRLAAIFDQFVQADASDTRKFGGTGLGLTIVKQLVELMGGTIGVDSTLGAGSTFWFQITLPLRESSRDTETHKKDTSRMDRAQLRLRQTDRTASRILLVEDNPVNQVVVKKILEKTGHDIDVANNGLEALALMERNQFDLVLMDCQMPEMDGFETTREIRKREQKTGNHAPIVAMTASAMKGDRERCLEAGMDDYVSKPIAPDALRKLVEAYLS